MQHTPGPWHVAADANGTMTTNSNGAQIAMWPPQGGTIEQCANARLIATAPDLLEALIMALPHLEAVARKDNACYSLARAAIARAS